jgi:uncharacterized membrane protein YheB (UPF0754 family)
MNKNFLTNFIAFLIMLIGSFSPVYQETLFMIGIFSLSGGLTNWLAIHMLFEKIPFFYGSGVIPNRFNEFKIGIKNLILNEFFNDQNINNFFKNNKDINSIQLLDSAIEEKIFNKLVEAIEESSLGSMLSMIGGKEALIPLKEPMIKKVKEVLHDLYTNQYNKNDYLSKEIKSKIEEIIENRLNELNPENVKVIIQNMIKKHLSWLVIWGSIIGGLIGFLVSYLSL